jgi:glycosyltransferase involved in cell wall biosynthesis
VLFYLADMGWSGCARATFTVAQGLAARNHTIAMACCGSSALESRARAANIDAVTINGSSSVPGCTLDLRKVLRERAVDIVVTATERDQLIVSSALRLAKHGGVLRRVPAFERVALHSGGKLALRIAPSGLVFTTERELEESNTSGWAIPPAVAPLGVDASRYDDIQPLEREALAVPRSGVLVACNYDISGRYRIPTIFRTLALLATRRVPMHVIVVGPGSTDDDLRMHASALGVGHLVTFLGDRADQLAVMRAADVGWVVSGADTGAFGCLDFMALRMPLIADRSPLTQHYVADGITGLLLASGDPSYTASGIAAFLASEDRRAAMGNAARARVQREFTERAMLDGFEHAVTVAGDRNSWAKT